jgi:hypothetical protein
MLVPPRKKPRFSFESDEIIERYYTAEDLKYAWLSADDWAASLQAIIGLEQFQNDETRMNQVQQGSSIRKSICLASREVNGCTIAAALSGNLSASDVKVAREIAIVDESITKHINGNILDNDFEHQSRCTLTPSNSFSTSCSKNSTLPSKDFPSTTSKRVHREQEPKQYKCPFLEA